MSKISCEAAALNVRWTFVQRGPKRSVDKGTSIRAVLTKCAWGGSGLDAIKHTDTEKFNWKPKQSQDTLII